MHTKFRGWHFGQKRMYSAEEMSEDQLTYDVATGQFINVHQHSRLSVHYPRDQFLPLRSSGLYDKNNIEIYEGDILKHKIHNRELSLIEVAYIDDYSEWWLCIYPNGRNAILERLGVYDYKELEIVGHIYDTDKIIS